MIKLDEQVLKEFAALSKLNTPLSAEYLDQLKLNGHLLTDLLSAKTEDGSTLLHLAVYVSKLTNPSLSSPQIHLDNIYVLIKYLLDKNIDINATFEGCSALTLAVTRPQFEVLGEASRDATTVKMLLERNPNTSTIDSDGNSLLYYAALRPVKVFDLLFEPCKTQINLRNNEGRTPLFYAARMSFANSSHLDVVKKLVAAGADVNAIDKAGNSILSYYLKEIKYNSQFYSSVNNLIDILVEAGVDLSHKDPDGRTIADLALQAGIPMRFFSKHIKGKTTLPEDADLLHYAAANGCIDFIKGLAQEKDINAKLSDGRTPLSIAIEKEGVNSYIVKELLTYGAEIPENLSEKQVSKLKALDRKIISPGMRHEFDNLRGQYAYGSSQNTQKIEDAEKHHLKGYKISDLLEAEDGEGNSLLHLSLSTQRYGISIRLFNYLLSVGANPTKKNKQGNTPLDLLAKLLSDYQKTFYYLDQETIELLLNTIDAKDFPKELRSQLFIHSLQLKQFEGYSEALFKAGVDINAVDRRGMSALHYACENNDIDRVNMLLAQGADPNIKNNSGETPLFKTKRCDIAEALIAAKANISETNAYQSSILQNALISYNSRFSQRITPSSEQINNHADFIRMLIARPDINVDLADKNGMTALFFAYDLEFFKALIEKGADPTICDAENNTLLHHAAREGNIDVYNYLVDQFPEMIKAVNKSGKTPLFVATSAQIISDLIARDPESVNKKDNEGITPINAVMERRQTSYLINSQENEIIKAFIEGGADISFAYRDKKSLAHYLAHNASKDLVETMVRNIVDPTERLAVMALALQRSNRKASGIDPEMFRPYIKGKADLGDSATLLHYAAYNGMTDVLEPLINVHDLDVNEALEEEGGDTPLSLAIQQHGLHSPIVEKLLSLGSKIPKSLSPQEVLGLSISHLDVLFAHKKDNGFFNYNYFVNTPVHEEVRPVALFFDFLSSKNSAFIDTLSKATHFQTKKEGSSEDFATILADRLCRDVPWTAYKNAKYTERDLSGISKLGLNIDDTQLSVENQPELQNALFNLMAYAGKLALEQNPNAVTQNKLTGITDTINKLLATNDSDEIAEILDEALQNKNITKNRSTGFYIFHSIFKADKGTKWNTPAKHVVYSTTEELLLKLKIAFENRKVNPKEDEVQDISSETNDTSSKSSKSN